MSHSKLELEQLWDVHVGTGGKMRKESDNDNSRSGSAGTAVAASRTLRAATSTEEAWLQMQALDVVFQYFRSWHTECTIEPAIKVSERNDIVRNRTSTIRSVAQAIVLNIGEVPHELFRAIVKDCARECTSQKVTQDKVNKSGMEAVTLKFVSLLSTWHFREMKTTENKARAHRKNFVKRMSYSQPPESEIMQHLAIKSRELREFEREFRGKKEIAISSELELLEKLFRLCEEELRSAVARFQRDEAEAKYLSTMAKSDWTAEEQVAYMIRYLQEEFE